MPEQTLRDRIQEALSGDSDMDRLIAFAYHVGSHDGAKRVCDTAAAIFAAQRNRASKVRYKHMALSVQGNIEIIYDADYSSDFPGWEMDGKYPQKF